MDSADVLAGPVSGDNSEAFVFLAPSNKPQASGSVSHCGENGVSNSLDHWSLDTCSADCSGSWYSGSLLDNCVDSDGNPVCDTDVTNDCTQDCNGDWGGPDNVKDNGDEAYNDHCNVCDNDPSNDCVVLTLSSDLDTKAIVSYVSSYDISGFQMNVGGLVIDSASSAFNEVSFNSSNGELLGYSSVGNDLPATCSVAYGELCPLDGAADLVGLQFAGSHNGYTLDTVSYTHLTLPTKRIV